MAGDCYDKALQLLARRPHFRLELARKLLTRKFREDQVEQVLTRLEQQGLIDDDRQAIELTLGPLTRKGYGPRRMRAELERRGVSSELAVAAVTEAFPTPESELEAARLAAERLSRRSGTSTPRLARTLERRGFSTRVILQLLEELETS